MTYGLSPRLFVENGPAVRAAEARAEHLPSKAYRAWGALDARRRLELVENALRMADNDIDGLPVAL